MTDVQVCQTPAECKRSCKALRSQVNTCLMSKVLKIFLLIGVLSVFPKAPWPQGTECVARYNFKGTSEHDLPFKKGDVLTIIVVTKVTLRDGGGFLDIFHLQQFVEILVSNSSIQDPNWYKAKNAAGCEGTIPVNYVQKREGVRSGGKLSLMP